jgi:hypothetical protein
MRVRQVEQTLVGLAALELADRAPLEHTQADVERQRHLLWNGKHEQTCQALDRIVSWAVNAALLNGAAVGRRPGVLSRIAQSCAATSRTMKTP